MKARIEMCRNLKEEINSEKISTILKTML